MKQLKRAAFLIISGFLRNQTVRLLKANPQVKVVAITGSVGKTTTKQIVAAVLGRKYDVLFHPGNYNTETGVPLSIFELESPGKLLSPWGWFKVWFKIELKLRRPYPYNLLVLELGADEEGEIEYFMDFLEPDFGIVTAVQPAHLEGFKTMDTILKEKFKLALASKHAILNADDSRLMSRAKEIGRSNITTYGVEQGDYRVDIKGFDLGKGFDATLHLKGKTVSTKLNLIGKHSLYAVAAASAIGDLLGLKPGDIALALQSIESQAGRMKPLAGANGSLLIDDSYNSSPDAAIAAIETLYSLPGDGRRIAILGTMNEQGEFSREHHREVGSRAGRLDYLVTIGKEAEEYLAPAAGLPASKLKSFASPYDAGKFVRDMVQKDDIVLIKGSQNRVFAEEATAILLADPSDKKHLVRQSPFWQERKKQQFA